MKRLNLYISVFSMLFSLSVLTACDEEENLFGNRDTSAGMYELSVTSAGFVPAEEQQSEGAETINIPFGNDDAIGVVMVDGEKITHTRYIYKELLSKWSGDLVVKNPSAKIYAYYPYNEALEISSLNTQGTNAAEFFNQMITDFVPQADQSKEENFRKSNLMVGTASLDETGKKISINMEPAMALAVVRIDPNKKGIMSLDSDPNYTWEVGSIYAESLVPFYKFSENTFVSYILPETEQMITTSSGRVIIPSISKSSYQECPLSLVHTLQPGDFFMKDGSLMGKDAILTAEQKANCIGIVFQTDENRIGKAEKEALEGKVHGLVMALKNVNNSTPLAYSTEKVEITGITNTVTLEDCYNDINGLANTKSIYAMSDYSSKYPIFNAVKSFGVGRPEDKTTDWFLPSVGQLWDLLVNLGGGPTKDTTTGFTDKGGGYFLWSISTNKVFDRINNQLKKADSDLLATGTTNNFEQFWVSSVYSKDAARKMLFNNWDLQMTKADKTGPYRARPILAF